MYNLLAILFIIAIVSLVYNALRNPKPKLKIARPVSNASSKPKAKIIKELSLEDFVNKYNYRMGAIKGGSVCLYGHWFGRPYDNFHFIKEIQYNAAISELKIKFDKNEILTLLNPLGITESKHQLVIKFADEITWEWNYEESNEKAGLHFIKITKEGNLLSGCSSAHKELNGISIKKPALTMG